MVDLLADGEAALYGAYAVVIGVLASAFGAYTVAAGRVSDRVDKSNEQIIDALTDELGRTRGDRDSYKQEAEQWRTLHREALKELAREEMANRELRAENTGLRRRGAGPSRS